MKLIIVLADGETWEQLTSEQSICLVTDEAFEKLEEGEKPKHLIDGEELILELGFTPSLFKKL